MTRTAVLVVALLVSGAVRADDPQPPAWVERARAAASELGQRLRSELADALARGGPAAGIRTCRVRAPEIAAALSAGGMTVGRTALRLRNPDNAPDAWEASLLRRFRDRIEAGDDDPSSLESWRVVGDGDRRVGRWMRAIEMQPRCTVCHGDAIPDAVAAELSRRYPHDRATGFEVGELRGAFTLSIELPATD